MKPKQFCLTAIAEWSVARTNYALLEPFFAENSSFVLDQEFSQWISAWPNTYFHSYLGVADGELLLICMPLDEEGQEVDLDEYFTTAYTPLEKGLELVEIFTTVKTERSLISTDMLVRRAETRLGDYFPEPTEITSGTAILEIERWAAYGNDWMYQQTLSATNNIARAYRIPLSDAMVLEDELKRDVLFSMKWIGALGQMIMSLIFVATPDPQNQTQDGGSTIQTNSSDFARPCPPFCREQKKFRLL